MLLAKVKKPLLKDFLAPLKTARKHTLYLALFRSFFHPAIHLIILSKTLSIKMTLEHTFVDLGQEYLNIIKQTPEFLDESIELCKQNDELGNVDVYIAMI